TTGFSMSSSPTSPHHVTRNGGMCPSSDPCDHFSEEIATPASPMPEASQCAVLSPDTNTLADGSAQQGIAILNEDASVSGFGEVQQMDVDKGRGKEEDAVCRVCHTEAEPTEGRPLYHPCLCRGSIKHVHQDCLMRWLQASSNTAKKCELCGASFAFTALYAPGAPAQLTSWEMVQGLM
ncbi:E3 ubiquitin-protein ligase MARCH6, partial [Nannochloropsis gaditana CCMP526]|uniref:E3 ubiquitin-protein ligase MARCH6 n=1 Tax=Nannochloropsis gaditana (strain CCMP526) TaxID=1093141 RepID=UPI00029F7F81